MRSYEMVLILKPDLSDDQLKEEVDKVKGLITKGGGQILHYEDWGKRKLAYAIRRQTKGSYHLFQFASDPQALAEVDRSLKLDEAVLRHMTVRMEEPKPQEA